MPANKVFDIPTSSVLENLNCWITTNSKNISYNHLPLRDSLSVEVNGCNLLEIGLSTNGIDLNLIPFEKFAFFLASRGKIYIEKRTMRRVFSDFDTLGIALNYSSFEVRSVKRIVEANYNKSILLDKLANEVRGEIILIHRKKFYSFHEVCFLRSNVVEVDSYISYLISKLVDFTDEDVWKIKTILYEIFDNALEHGNKFDICKLIRSETLISNNGFHIEVSDQGEGFSFEVLRNLPDKGSSTGRGLTIVRMLSDITAIKDKGKTIEVFVSRSNTFPINLHV